MHESEKWKWSCSVVPDSQRPHGLQPTRLLHPWDFPGKNTGVGCHCLLHISIQKVLNKYLWNKSRHLTLIPTSQALLQSGLDVSQAMTLIPPSQALLQSGLGVSSVLAWRIPGTEEPGGLPSMGSHRVGHNWSDLAAAAAGYDIDPFPPSPPPVWVGCISGSEFGRGFLQLLWSPCSHPRLT